MTRVHPGWLVALFAAILSVSAWLPWLTTSAHGGGRASAIGGTAGSIALPPRFGVGQLIVLLAAVLVVAGAMIGRGLFSRLASVVALVVSLGIVGLGVAFYRLNVVAPITAGYGLYIGAVSVAGALGCSVWALLTAARR
ncbi:hypothetical protein [Mycolicibacter senuensis]|uniref:Transmembrane protein n=1 Tax=Mycolicibacter senuensis TaxID=386913 RepID=A0A7I9XLB9_9MYCO|nr:hypothetical protein [Mycolicibacter senuensis]MDQ2625803.1 hypothetical protein [Actinomycetota bacterium]ORW66566.1 hypothetical protein AWC24_14100 [Mycolicibacter senuensis]GFG70714.1 hypothetical protein MSEN_24340 [Mycolicibacter senuensis]